MEFSIVNFSELISNSDFRIDAEYYNPVYLKIHERIKSKEHVLFFSKIKKIGSGKNLPQVENGNYKFIRTQNVRPVLIADTGMSSTNELKKLSLTKEGEMIFVRVGQGVGDSSVITKKYSGNAVSDNVLRLEIEGINPFYCSIFFNSKIGQIYFKRNFKGTARGLISQENFKDILIPVFSVAFQEAIQNCVEESQDLIEKSKYAYQQAQDFLLAELGLDGWQPTHQLWWEKDYLETVEAERIDAEYYQPKYDEIINAIKGYKGGYSTVGKEFIQNKTTFQIEDDKLYQYVEIGSVNVSNGEIVPEKVLGVDAPANAKRILHKNDVIISKVRTYRGAITIVEKQGYVGSGAFTILAENGRVNKETLLAFLHSKPLLAWSLKPNTGVSYPVIKDDDILNLPIPIILKDKQLEIQEKVMKSFELRERSKELLENAKRAVEIAIEQDETAAIKSLTPET